MMQTPCEQIARDMGELFECSPLNGYTRIRTPYLYPDGDVIDLFLADSQGIPTLTDLGQTLGWLRTQTVSGRKTARQRWLIEDICTTHGVEFYRGMILARIREPEGIGSAVNRLSQAALRVADLWFTFRSQVAADRRDEVGDFLMERRISFDRGEKLVGRSGRTWVVDYHTRTADRSALVSVLTSGSKAAAHRQVEHTLTTWYDLSHLKVGVEAPAFVSLFDDDLDIWAPEDFMLLEDISEVAYWSRKDEFAELLGG